MPDSRPITPISFTLNPRLDASLAEGWEAWEGAARAAGAPAVSGWIAQRLGRANLRTELQADVEAFLQATDPEERALAIADLAEIVEGHDDALADTLWEALLALGFEQEDPDTIIEATSRLAAIAEEHGDALAAAEYHIDFLNWRRQVDHTSDPEAVADAFDEIVRLAGVDGNPQAVAIWEFRLTSFIRLDDADDETASSGDWERSPIAYESWE